MNTKKIFVSDRKAVRAVFKKSDKEVEGDIEIIRTWVKTQPHLPEIPNDNMIEVFLTTNKFSIERTKERLDMYYTIRSFIPEFYKNSNPQLPLMKTVPEKIALCAVLPKQTKDLYRAFMMKLTGSAEDFDMYLFFTHVYNMMEMKLQHDAAVGDVFVVDHQNLSMGHVLKITPVHVKKVAAVLEKVFSNRLKGMYVVNWPPYVDIVLNIVKVFFKPKLFSRIHLHKNLEELYEYIPREILPRDYGGDEPTLKELSDMSMRMLAENSERFDKLDKMRVKEDLRPTPLENDEILGYHGNFKKLDVD